MKKIFLILLVFITNTSYVLAGDNDISLDMQVNIFLKTISYYKNIPDNNLIIGIVSDSSNNKSVKDKDIILQNLNSLKNDLKKNISVENISISNYNKKNYSILYFTKGLNIPKSKLKTSAITWSSDSEYVKNGIASIGIINKNNRAKLLINMNSLESEGHIISSQLLKLAQIIQ